MGTWLVTKDQLVGRDKSGNYRVVINARGRTKKKAIQKLFRSPNFRNLSTDRKQKMKIYVEDVGFEITTDYKTWRDKRSKTKYVYMIQVTDIQYLEAR